MERVVKAKSGEIRYILTKKKIKKMYLRVKPEGNVLVSVPSYVTLKECDAFVLKNEGFIVEALGRMAERQEKKESQHTYQNGDEFYVLGEKLTLRLQEGFPILGEKQDDYLIVQVTSLGEEQEVMEGIRQFYTQEMRRVFLGLMDQYQVALSPLGIPLAQMKIREMKSQWGSCNRRNNVITLNSRLIHLPFDCIEYVVVHEFCHFIHGNHSKDFYDLVAVYVPDWKARRQAMKQWGELF